MMLTNIKCAHGLLSGKLNLVAYLTAENLALRQQLIVLKRNQTRPKLKEGETVYSGCCSPESGQGGETPS